MFHPRLSPGGGATEMAVSVRLAQKAKGVEGVQQWPYKAVADALEVIPRALVQNAGKSPVRVLTELRAKQAEGKSSYGVNGDTGAIADMNEYGVWEPEAIKLQSLKTAIEVCFHDVQPALIPPLFFEVEQPCADFCVILRPPVYC